MGKEMKGEMEGNGKWKWWKWGQTLIVLDCFDFS